MLTSIRVTASSSLFLPVRISHPCSERGESCIGYPSEKRGSRVGWRGSSGQKLAGKRTDRSSRGSSSSAQLQLAAMPAETRLPDGGTLSRAEQKVLFDRDGFLICRGLLDQEETSILCHTAKGDTALKGNVHGIDDGEGRETRMVLWNKPSDDLYGVISRLSRVVDTMEFLLDDEVYHYHSKMITKEPSTGGFAWHQDYGYWYQNGCLFPDMGSVMIAVDPNTRENGCLQILRGSHKLGRIEHGRYGGQAGADPEHTDAAMKLLDLVYCELEPGDALFFHCNILHRSDANLSPNPRWSLLCCYNTKHNNPYKESHHPFYEPLNKLPDTAIKELGVKQSLPTKRFWTPEEDKTVGDVDEVPIS